MTTILLILLIIYLLLLHLYEYQLLMAYIKDRDMNDKLFILISISLILYPIIWIIQAWSERDRIKQWIKNMFKLELKDEES